MLLILLRKIIVNGFLRAGIFVKRRVCYRNKSNHESNRKKTDGSRTIDRSWFMGAGAAETHPAAAAARAQTEI